MVNVFVFKYLYRECVATSTANSGFLFSDVTSSFEAIIPYITCLFLINNSIFFLLAGYVT